MVTKSAYADLNPWPDKLQYTEDKALKDLNKRLKFAVMGLVSAPLAPHCSFIQKQADANVLIYLRVKS